MIYLLAFVVLVLASARATRVVVFDEIGLPLRRWVLNRWPLPSKPGKLVTCYWCAGFWVSGLFSLIAIDAIRLAGLVPALDGWQGWAASAKLLFLLTFATSYAVGVALDMEERANGIGS